MTARAAVFLDRDGTLINDPGYLRRVEDLQLLDGVVEALRSFQSAGLLCIVVTNQSGIGRGRLTREQYQTVADALDQRLGVDGVRVDRTLMCPHLPDAGCLCRKPRTGLHRQAIAEFGIDAARSWFVGDHVRDLMPARELGGRGVLLLTGQGREHRGAAEREGFETVSSLRDAAGLILGYL